MRRALLWVGLSLCVASVASAQIPSATTQTGSVSKGQQKVFTFTPPSFGQVTVTLSWDTQGARLLMVMACGTSEAQTYGIAAGLLDRFARFESGVIGGEPCAIALSTVDQTANFRLHVIRSGDQFLTPAAVGSVALVEARDRSFLGDEALRVLNRVMIQALR